MQAQAQITQAFMPLAAYAVGSFADGKQKEAIADAKKAAEREDWAKVDEYMAEAEKWGESGMYRIGLHTAVGALGGGVNGALGAAGAAGTAKILNVLEADARDALREAGLSDGNANALAQGLTNLIATGVGAAVGGVGGAATALNVDANNRQLHPKEIEWTKKNASSFAKELSDKLERPVSEAEALMWLTTAGESNVDKVNQELAAAQNGLSTTEQSRAFFAAKEFIKENAKGITFVDDRGQQQKLFVATGTDFRNSTVYSEYRNDPAYRDFYWEVKGDNLKPDNPTPQELAIYKERERQRLLNSAKTLVTGAIPAVMAGAAGKVAAGTSKPGATTDSKASSTPAGTKNMTVGDEPLGDGGMNHPVGINGNGAASGSTLPGLNRPVRSVNPDFPPNQSVVDAMNSPQVQKMTNANDCVDCSEIAGRLLNSASGKGQILEVRPAQQGNLNVFENGVMAHGQYYHQVYTDGRYVYDPRLSSRPIPKGDWEQHIRNINPNGVTISTDLRGLR